ncbi:MAG: RagB/SusD family nutrient uptake outer membrane protein [Chitinophagaceae bacterium]
MNLTNKILVIFAGMVLASSCSKQLALLPSDSVVESLAFPTVASLERGIIGVYAQFNGAYDDEIYASALYSDEATLPTENNTGRGVATYRWQVDPGDGDVTSAWFSYYFAIDRANRVLAAADKIKGINATEESQRLRIKGEALALRAFGHLQLMINYSENYELTSLGVAYMEKSEISKPSRITVGADITKINADLTLAATLIPSTFTSTSSSRITQNVLYAIRARTALYAKNWDDAIAASTSAINAVPLASRANYPLIWTDKSVAEVIWKNVRDVSQERIGDTYYDRSLAKIMYGPSSELASSFTTTDIRLASTVLSRGAGRNSLGKYIGGDANEPNRADVKVFRTAEMYLIRAEAYAEKANLTGAAADLNGLRAARISPYVPQVYTDKPSFITEVIQERFKELAFEGQRMSDLKRRLLPVTRLAVDAINALGAVTLNPADKVYYYPIPDSEIKANENMVQNPRYR